MVSVTWIINTVLESFGQTVVIGIHQKWVLNIHKPGASQDKLSIAPIKPFSILSKVNVPHEWTDIKRSRVFLFFFWESAILFVYCVISWINYWDCSTSDADFTNVIALVVERTSRTEWPRQERVSDACRTPIYLSVTL